MWAALAAVPDLLPNEVRVVVLRGAGSGFCAGLDLRMATAEGVPGETSLREVVGRDERGITEWIAGLQRAYTWLADPRWISIAVVQGAAVGAGFQLALAADLRVVAADARFCMKETALGLVPDLTGTGTLVRAVGYSRALELCATARWVDAAEAERIGLATSVVPNSELESATATLCEQLLATDAAAVVAVKDLVVGAALRDAAGAAEAERIAQVPLLRSLCP